MFDVAERTGDLPPDFDHQLLHALSSQPDAYQWLWCEWQQLSYGYQLLWCLCSEPARSRERMISNDKTGTWHSTHIEDLKNPIQLQPPTRNLPLVITGSKVFDQRVLPGQFVDLPLNFLNTPVIKSTVGKDPKYISPDLLTSPIVLSHCAQTR